MRAHVAAIALACAPVAASCSCGTRDLGEDGASTTAAGGAADGSGGFDVLVGVTTGGPPPPQNLCGSQVHEVSFDPPALYFVLDASGSMADDAAEAGHTRSEVLHAAVVDLVGRLGDRARVGANLFPTDSSDGIPCLPGREVFPVKLGDPPEGGSTTRDFADATAVTPSGGTPTAATLEVVREALSDVDGRRVVILVTDGGPNCNDSLTCGASTCIPNIEGDCPEEYENCCDPEIGGEPGNCLDRSRTLEAVVALREEGVDVHVIGYAGSAPFAATLGQMAILGGSATDNPPYYNEATDIEDLSAALGRIAVANVGCVLEIDEPPDVPWRTNVWLDDEVLDYDTADGWMWRGAPLDYVPVPPADAASTGAGGSGPAAGGAGSGGSGSSGGAPGGGASGGASSDSGGGGGGFAPEVDTTAVELRGDACERFKSGVVRRVTIVTGCPLVPPT